MASWVIVRSRIRLRVLCAGVSTGGVLGERMPKSAIRWDLRGGLVMGIGVGIMRHVWRGTRSSCVLALVSLCAMCPLIAGVGVGVTLGSVRGACIGEWSGVLLAASWKMSWRSPSDLRVEMRSCGDLMPWRVLERCAADAMTRSSGVTDGLVKYLCLKKAAPEMRVARVVGVQNFQHR